MAKRKKSDPKWWMTFLSESDQEVERGRVLYEAVAEDAGDAVCFQILLENVEQCMKHCRKMDPEDETERWLFFAAFFHGAGMLMRERISYYQKKKKES